MKNKPTTDYIQGTIDRISNVVKNGKIKLKRRRTKVGVFNDNNIDIPDFNRDSICRNARKKAHNEVSDMKKKISDDVRNDLAIEED